MIVRGGLLTRVFVVFFAWKGVLYLFATLSALFVPMKHNTLGFSLGLGTGYLHWIWANFDGVHYSYIAQYGYQYPNYAFFPLLPLLISLVKKTFSTNIVASGLLVTNISFFISLYVLSKVAALDVSKSVVFLAILSTMLFPLSFFYQSVYTESVFLLFTLLSFYSARSGRWVLASIFGYFATLTRIVGVALLPALMIEWYWQRQKKRLSLLWLLLIPLGLVTYMGYLQLFHGDALLFQKAMKNWGQSETVVPLQTFIRYMKIFVFAQRNVVYWVAVLEFVSAISYLALAVFVILRVRLSYGVFMLTLLFIPTFTGTLQSMPRYLLQLFPAFIALGMLADRSKIILIGGAVLFLLLQFIFVAMFTRGYFVA